MKMPSSSDGAVRVSLTRWNSRRRPTARPDPAQAPARCGGAGSSGGEEGRDEELPQPLATRRRWKREKISLISDDDEDDLVEARLRRAARVHDRVNH